jgi:hypothetical protein
MSFYLDLTFGDLHRKCMIVHVHAIDLSHFYERKKSPANKPKELAANDGNMEPEIQVNVKSKSSILNREISLEQM